MYFYRDYFILHPNQVICRVWSLRLFYRLSLWLAYMLYAKIVIKIKKTKDRKVRKTQEDQKDSNREDEDKVENNI